LGGRFGGLSLVAKSRFPETETAKGRDSVRMWRLLRRKEPGASDRFKEIAQAYAVLSDPKKRAEYDARGYAGVAGFSPEDLFGGINFEDIFGGLGFDLGAAGVFDRVFRRRARPRRGDNIEIEIAVPLERVLNRGEETVHVERPATCQACQGSGAKAGTKPRTCPKCGGSGQFVRTQRTEGVSLQHIATCPECAGRGSIIDAPCSQCVGKGEVVREEALTLRIPMGVEESMALRVPATACEGRSRGCRRAISTSSSAACTIRASSGTAEISIETDAVDVPCLARASTFRRSRAESPRM
jgi:molecular chaperone DnaJ